MKVEGDNLVRGKHHLCFESCGKTLDLLNETNEDKVRAAIVDSEFLLDSSLGPAKEHIRIHRSVMLHPTFTPYEACDALLDTAGLKRPRRGKSKRKILVLYTVEMAIQLVLRGFSRDNIAVYTEDECLVTRDAVERHLDMEYLTGDLEDMKFDVIVGNPPYQGSGKGSQLWPSFVRLALEHINDDGVLSLIHPPSWRAYKSRVKLAEEMFQYDITDIVMRNEAQTNSMFNGAAAISTDSYTLVKRPNRGKTKVTYTTGKTETVDTTSLSWLPNQPIQVLNLLPECEEEARYVYVTQQATVKKGNQSPTASAAFPLLVALNVKTDLSITEAYVTSDCRERSLIGTPKILVSKKINSDRLFFREDALGAYGINDNSIAAIPYTSAEHRDLLLWFLALPKVHSDLKATWVGGYQFNHRVLSDVSLSEASLQTLKEKIDG